MTTIDSIHDFSVENLKEQVARQKDDAFYWKYLVQQNTLQDINHYFKYCDLMHGATLDALKNALEQCTTDEIAEFMWNLYPTLAWFWDIDIDEGEKSK